MPQPSNPIEPREGKASAWTRRAVIAGACTTLGIAIRLLDEFVSPWKYGRRPTPTRGDPVLPAAGSEPTRVLDYRTLAPLTLPWALALGVAPDRDLAERASSYLAVVQQHRDRSELARGAARLVELALAGTQSDGDGMLLCALSALTLLGQSQAIADVRQRIPSVDAFPRSVRFLERRR